MKRFWLVAAALLCTTAAAEAKGTPPTTQQQAAFLKECLTVAPAAGELCKCKAEAVMKLVDTDFIEVIIASMKGKPLDHQYYNAYNDYIARSNKICKPTYM